MFNNIRGVLTFKATGAKLEDFINTIKQSEIPCFNIHCTNGTVIGSIYNKYYNKLCIIANSQKVEISIETRKGLFYKVIRYKKRFGIIVGLIIAICFIFYMSNIVLKIQISGNAVISDDKILAILNENGISYGEFIPNLNFLRTERNMMTSMKNLAWVGIRKTGGRIVVDIDEMVKSPEIIPLNVPCNIVSTKNAQIINAKVYCGNLVPKVGDGVKAGDLLISGATTNRFGKSSILHAQGIIIGQYKEKIVFTQKFEEEQNLLSSDEVYRKEFSFFGLKLPLYFGDKIEGEYEYDENTNNFSFFNITLPIGITHERYKPFTTQLVTYTADEAQEEILCKIANYELNFLQDKKIISKETQLSSNQDEMQMTVLYMLESEIGINKEFMAKK